MKKQNKMQRQEKYTHTHKCQKGDRGVCFWKTKHRRKGGRRLCAYDFQSTINHFNPSFLVCRHFIVTFKWRQTKRPQKDTKSLKLELIMQPATMGRTTVVVCFLQIVDSCDITKGAFCFFFSFSFVVVHREKMRKEGKPLRY